MSSAPEFDAVYIVSDLHMGGQTGGQIFNAGELLASTIDHLAESSPRSNVGLIINGDSVDFIAEPNPVYFDSTGAASRLRRIMDDPAFAPVWQALARFVGRKRRTLIFNLGNHDFELALPAVRRLLLESLANGDDAALGRIQLNFDGTGVKCSVGGASVLCLHGNEVDNWNLCDYEELRRQVRDLNLGVKRDSWTPNAGTKLVIDVMNGIKKNYPFVDLLKPENEAVIPTLYTLDTSLKSSVFDAVIAYSRNVFDGIKRSTGFLAAGGPEPNRGSQANTGPRNVDELLQKTFGGAGQGRPEVADDTDDLLRVAEQRFRNQEDPLDMGGAGTERLGIGSAIMDWFRGRKKHEVLREALQGLTSDTSFDLDDHDATFIDIDEMVGRGADFLVTGHTHQRRAIVRSGGGFYYNSGTWVRLIKLTPDVLKDEAAFARVFEAFEEGTMSALDREPELILKQPTVVAIRSKKTGVVGTLCEPRNTSEGIELQEVADSKFEKR